MSHSSGFSVFRFFVLLRNLKLFPKSFLFSFGKGFFYCSLENISNMKILHSSDTVTTQLICGSRKAGNTAYFFHPPLLINFIATSTLFWESTLMQKYCCLFICAREIIFIPKAFLPPKILDYIKQISHLCK